MEPLVWDTITIATAARCLPALHFRDFRTMERLRWCCSMTVSASSLFHRPAARISTQASWTFCHPWKRPRWLMAPMRPGHIWCTSWKSISFQRCLPPKRKAMVAWTLGQVRSGSDARNSFHQCEWLKLVMKTQAAAKPQRQKQETKDMNLQPSLSGFPMPQEPSNQTQPHRKVVQSTYFTRTGNHFL